MSAKFVFVTVIISSWLALSAHAGDAEKNIVDSKNDAARIDLLRVPLHKVHANSSPRIDSAFISQDGFIASGKTFPAISLDKGLIAILVVPQPHEYSVVMEIRNRDGKTIKSFDIVAREDRRRMASGSVDIERIRKNISNANQYLTQHQFKPMQRLFRKAVSPGRFIPKSITDADGWAYPVNMDDAHLDVGNYRLVFNHEELKITKTSEHSNWTIHIPQGVLHPNINCSAWVHPAEGWVSEELKALIILLTEHSAGHCDGPDEWRIYPFPE